MGETKRQSSADEAESSAVEQLLQANDSLRKEIERLRNKFATPPYEALAEAIRLIGSRAECNDKEIILGCLYEPIVKAARNSENG